MLFLNQIILADELQKSQTTTQEIIIKATQTDVEAQRDFVAGKIIIGRKRIEESGLQTVAEFLKREPAITVGRDGRLGLIGLSGYTQILIDGAPAPSGKGINELDLKNVEKIELVKSTVAEFGPFSIAGTINIISRKVDQTTYQQIQVGIGGTGQRANGNIAWSINQPMSDSPISLSVQLSANTNSTPSSSAFIQTVLSEGLAFTTPYTGTTDNNNQNSILSANSTVVWQANPRNSFKFSPGIGNFVFKQTSEERKNYGDGRSSNARQQTRGPLTFFSLPLNWNFKASENIKLDLNWNSNLLYGHSSTIRTEIFLPPLSITRTNEGSNKSIANTLRLTSLIRSFDGHEIKSGGDVYQSNADSKFSYQINGGLDPSLNALGEQRHIHQSSYNLFLQDNWRLSEGLAFNVGLSYTNRSIDITEGSFRTEAKFRLLSPSLHIAQKINDDDKRQIRFSIAQSYKAPDPDQLGLRPTIHPLALCTVSGLCIANSVETADRAGNPHLQPERALGLNLSYDHGIGKDSQLSFELFARKIDSLIGTDINRENVSWSSEARYVARPMNFGNATILGLETAMQLSLRDIWQEAPKIEMRGNIDLGYSKISTFPKPNNRLSNQLPWQAKIGFTWDSQDWPLKISADANWTPSDWVRTNLTQRIFYARKLNFGANAIWKFSKEFRLILTVDNLLDKTSKRIDEYVIANEVVRLQEFKTTATKINLRLDIKL